MITFLDENTFLKSSQNVIFTLRMIREYAKIQVDSKSSITHITLQVNKSTPCACGDEPLISFCYIDIILYSPRLRG